jgi:hypothetical protein
MNKVKSLAVLVGAVLCFLTGCAEQQQAEAIERICVPNLEKTQAMQMAEDVLGEMHFTIAKADAEQGLIRTRPLPGAQFFEFWRSDNVGPFNSAEANIHSIRRTAELKITQQHGQLCLCCNVEVDRLNLPEHQVSSSSQAYRMFSVSGPSMQRLELHPEQKEDMAWVEVGNDTMLSTKILTHLKERIAELQKEKML